MNYWGGSSSILAVLPYLPAQGSERASERDPPTMIKSVKVLRRLLLKLKRIFYTSFSVKRYVTLGDAWHHVFIVCICSSGP